MFLHILFQISFVAIASCETKRFPDDFLFGVATSAYQIEGGWNVDGKGPSVWDDFTHSHPEEIDDQQNGDVAANSYEYFLDDIEAIKNLNMSFYRFSIAWSRVLPKGDVSNINEKGIAYYNNLIDKLLERNIEPMITIYHWDLPLKLQSFGGFTNSAIINYFRAYANLLFERFGDRVKYWITFNEPHMFCTDTSAAGMTYSGVSEYLCGHNVLKSHAVVYHLYKESFHHRFKGQIGIALDMFFPYSNTNDTTADRAMQFEFGWFAAPIFSERGGYPAVMIKHIGENSEREGLPYSRLPVLSLQWIETIRGTADFLGLNYYTSRVVTKLDEPDYLNPSYEQDRGVIESVCPEWKQAGDSWLYSVPQGIADLLRWISKEYKNPPVFITENGWLDYGELQDDDRIEYYHDHLQQVLDVVLKNECDVKGYTAWTLIDGFEWLAGYTINFGLYAIHMTSQKKERIPKKSSEFIRKVTTTRQIPDIN